jgi:hypothetical protein
MQAMEKRGTRASHHGRRVPLNNPARIFQPLAKALGWMETGQDYGLNTPGLLAKYDRTSQSWRTSEPSASGDLTGFSVRLPKSGMTRNGRIYGPATWRRPTKENGFGLWRTPEETDGGRGGMSGEQARFLVKNRMTRKSGAKAQINLRDQVKNPVLFPKHTDIQKTPDIKRELFPTPCAQDYKHRGPHSRQQGLSDVVRQRPAPAANGNTGNKNDFFLTPRATDTGKGEKQKTFLKRMGDRTDACFQSLPAQVGGQLNVDWVEALMGYPQNWTDIEKDCSLARLWPTPTARDYKDGSKSSCANVPVNGLLGRAVHADNPEDGQLSATWTESLMGYPKDWTDIEKGCSFENRYPEAWLSGEWEDGLPRVITGQKNRPRRIKALGNSIVPQIPYLLFLSPEFDRWR